MAIGKDDVLFVYRASDADSLEVALYYKAAHGLGDDQLLAVACSADEVLPGPAAFRSQVEQPILDYIGTSGFDPSVIVVGYNVPGGFVDGEDVVSSTSRLIRLGHPFVKRKPNPLYDRKVSHRLGDNDLAKVRVAARIDGPTPEVAKSLISQGVRVLKQARANGTFYIDPFPTIVTDHFQTYSQDLNEFVQTTLPRLLMPTFTTVDIDPYVDVTIPYVQDDSFYWGCGAGVGDSSYFRTTGAVRIFFYNAADSGATSVRDAASRRFTDLAVSAGYANVGAAMSDPVAEQYVRPRPFFESLMQGASTGEAYVFALPLLDSSETFIGDPLLTFTFPVTLPDTGLFPASVGTARMLEDLQRAAGYLYRKQLLAETVRNDILGIADTATKVAVFYPAQNLANAQAGRYVALLSKLANYSTSLLSGAGTALMNSDALASYLTANNLKLGQVLANVLAVVGVVVPEELIYTEGVWQFETPLLDRNPDNFSRYQFELSVALDTLGHDVIYSFDSEGDQYGWKYEKEPGVFADIPFDGVPSSYVGRHVRFEGDITESLFRGELVYATLKQKDEFGVYAPFTSTLVVYT